MGILGTIATAVGGVAASVTTGGLADVALGATALGAATSAVGAYANGQSASKAAAYQAQVALNNQTIADQNAQYALQSGQQQQTAKQQQTAQQISAERAETAASGIDPNTGSATRIQGSTAALGALDAQTSANNAARTAWGYQNQGADFGAQAALLKSQASSASASGALGAFSSIIGGASSVSSKWAQYSQMGVWGGPGATNGTTPSDLIAAYTG